MVLHRPFEPTRLIGNLAHSTDGCHFHPIKLGIESANRMWAPSMRIHPYPPETGLGCAFRREGSRKACRIPNVFDGLHAHRRHIMSFLFDINILLLYSNLHMARIGRPKKPKNERQSRLIALRLTANEYRTLEQLARKSGLSVSDCVRRALGFKGK